jgi:hypothetical protein
MLYLPIIGLVDLDQTLAVKWFLESPQMLYRAFVVKQKHNNACFDNGSENQPGSPPYRGIDDEWIV